MAILPVSSISFSGSRGLNNTGKEDVNISQDRADKLSQVSSSVRTVPVVVLMALNPALLNAKVPYGFENTSQADAKVIYSDNARENDARTDAATYVMEPQQSVTQSKSPYGWGVFNVQKIKYAAPAKMSGDDCDIVYASYNKTSKDVDYVYLINDKYRGTEARTYHPAEIVKLVRHTLGEGKDYWEAVVDQDIINKEGKFAVQVRRGVRLDDKTAENLVNMIKGKTEWNNGTYISVSTSKAERVHPFTEKRY